MIAGDDQPGPRGNRLAAANPLEAVLLKQPQQLGLRGGRQIADRIQQQGSFAAALALADTRLLAARLAAEQFAVGERFGKSGGNSPR